MTVQRLIRITALCLFLFIGLVSTNMLSHSSAQLARPVELDVRGLAGVPTGTAQGKVFDGMPTALSGVGGFGRTNTPGTPPTYGAENDTGNGRGFRQSLVYGRNQNPLAYGAGYGQVVRGFPDATANPGDTPLPHTSSVAAAHHDVQRSPQPCNQESTISLIIGEPDTVALMLRRRQTAIG